MLGLKYTRVMNMPIYTWFYVKCILKILSIDFFSFKYAKVLNVSGV